MGARCGQEDQDDFDTGMEELRGLTKACDIEPVFTVTQNLSTEDAATYIGSGKIDEIRGIIEMYDIDTAIFNNTLSPSQLGNLSKTLNVEVIDRTGLILLIFAERARTREARLQVDYAQLKYMLPRLVGLRANLSRQGGTGGSLSNKGSGEKQIELDRRKIEKEMAILRRELAEVEKTRQLQRNRRSTAGIPLVALVGYTNAGKSTLMNKLIDTCGVDSGQKVFVQDMLFATLDTTVRRIELPGHRPFLLSDTVGFIDELPTTLVKAFRSTLSEAVYADLLLEVIDFSDPDYMTHIEITEKTLQDIGASKIPIIYVFNKADLVVGNSEHRSMTIPHVRDDRIYMSAEDGIGLDDLVTMIERTLEGEKVDCEFIIPYSDGAALHDITSRAEVSDTEYTEEGTHLTLKCSKKMALKYMKYAV